MKRRNFTGSVIAGAGAVTLGWPGIAQPQVTDINDAIKKAGRQRMLSQRVAKSYMATGQKVQGNNADRILSASMALSDRQLVELKAFAPSAEIKATYGSLETAWSDYKTALVGSIAPGRPRLLRKKTYLQAASASCR